MTLQTAMEILQKSPINELYDFEIVNHRLIGRNNLSMIYISIKQQIRINNGLVFEVRSGIHDIRAVLVYSTDLLVDAVQLLHSRIINESMKFSMFYAKRITNTKILTAITDNEFRITIVKYKSRFDKWFNLKPTPYRVVYTIDKSVSWRDPAFSLYNSSKSCIAIATEFKDLAEYIEATHDK